MTDSELKAKYNILADKAKSLEEKFKKLEEERKQLAEEVAKGEKTYNEVRAKPDKTPTEIKWMEDVVTIKIPHVKALLSENEYQAKVTHDEYEETWRQLDQVEAMLKESENVKIEEIVEDDVEMY